MRFIERFLGLGMKLDGTRAEDLNPGKISYRERVESFIRNESLVDNALLYVGVALAYFGVDLATRYGSTPGVPSALLSAGFTALAIWSFRIRIYPLIAFFAVSAFYLGSNAFYQMQDWHIYAMLHL